MSLIVFHIALIPLKKVLNPIILSPSYGKIVGQTGSFALVWEPVEEKENSEFKPVNLCL